MKIQYLVAVLSFLYLSDSAPVDNDETVVMLTYPYKNHAEGD